jgi:hypothetical protein
LDNQPVRYQSVCKKAGHGSFDCCQQVTEPECVNCICVSAGTGLKEAVTLLEAMLNDNTDFVRQGASIAMALVLLQQPESVVEPFRKKVSTRRR